jgi:hypothetical protein
MAEKSHLVMDLLTGELAMLDEHLWRSAEKYAVAAERLKHLAAVAQAYRDAHDGDGVSEVPC